MGINERGESPQFRWQVNRLVQGHGRGLPGVKVCLCLAINTLTCARREPSPPTMDFITTIDSDDEERTRKHDRKLQNEDEEYHIDPDFHFGLSEDPYVELLRSDKDTLKRIAKPVGIFSLTILFSELALLNYP